MHREDVATAEGLTPEEQSELWRNLATGAESGWDFSTRWFADGSNLDSIQTTK
jgi:alpha,alpha-trehalase